MVAVEAAPILLAVMTVLLLGGAGIGSEGRSDLDGHVGYREVSTDS